MKDIVWSKNKVSYCERCNLVSQRGLVIWFTGLSASGKSTIAVELEKRLVDRGKLAYILDGDNMRYGLNSDLGFSDSDRNENIRRIAEVCNILEDNAIIVLATFISPTQSMRNLARSKIKEGHFVEVYVKASVDLCIKRDPKGLYKRALNGEIKNFTGLTSIYEEPLNPDITLDTAKYSIDECVNIMIQKIYEIQMREEKL